MRPRLFRILPSRLFMIHSLHLGDRDLSRWLSPAEGLHISYPAECIFADGMPNPASNSDVTEALGLARANPFPLLETTHDVSRTRNSHREAKRR